MSLIEGISAAVASPHEHGQALPFAAYSDPDIYELERQRVFHDDWVPVCAAGAISKPGDRFATRIAGEPVVIVRGKDGQLRALSNSCRHRGTPIADDGISNAKSLVCPYHSWNYSDTGELKGVPYPGSARIDKSAHCLPEFALREYFGLVFVNVSGNAGPIEARFEGLDEYLRAYNVHDFKVGYEGPAEVWSTNWKLAMENAAESYHLFKVHKKTLEMVSPTRNAFYVAGCSEWAVTAGETRSDWKWWYRLFGASKDSSGHYVLIMMPPSLVAIITPGYSFDYLIASPEAPGVTTIRTGGLQLSAGKGSRLEAQFVADFFAEDKWICERAYTGMQARHSSGGQLVEMERVVRDFHHYYANRLTGAAVPDVYVEPSAHERLESAA